MNHPDSGVLRRLVDEPAGVAVADRRHVQDCAACLDALVAVRRDADRVAAALAPDLDGVDVGAAWQRLSGTAGAVPPRAAHRPRRRARLLRSPATAAAAVAVVLAGASTAAANDWLQVFRTERVAAVPFSPADLVALPDLSAYGELAVTTAPAVRSVADAAAAEAATGLDVPDVAELPSGVTGEPLVQVGDRAVATFTLSDRTSPPPGLAGTAVRLEAGPGVLQTWRSTSGAPALVVGRAVAPTAFSTGAPFEQVRDHLLSVPGLPADVAAQLRTFAADGSTLPLPVPADAVETRSTEVDGADATVLETRDGTLAAVVWVVDGTVTVVAGSLDDSEVLDVARALR